MNEADTATLLNLWKDSNKARGVTGSIVLDAGSGFFPFGPDLGDAGTFGARMTRLDPSPPLEEPWLYFRNTVEFVMTSNPAYGLPAEQDEGDLQIGGITGLRYPPTFPEPSIEYAQTTPLTRDGTPYTLDKQPADDKYETTLPMVLRHNKAAALVNHMVVTVRDNNVTIVDAGNGYLFGRSPGEGASFACQWLNEVLTVKHDGFDQFSFPLSFYYTGSVS